TKNHRQIEIDLPLYQSHAVASQRFLDLAGEAANGTLVPSPAVLVADQLPEDDPQYEVATRYKDDYESTYDEPVSTFGGYAFDGLNLLVKAIEEAGNTEDRK